jgi:hypothetical protein
VSIGFLVFKNHRGKGFAKNTLELLDKYLTKEFPKFQIIIGTNISNLPMRKIVESGGFCPNTTAVNATQGTITYVREIPPLPNTSPPEIPDLIRRARKIGIAANDAGGAEQLVWLLRELNREVTALLDGPAIAIFKRAQIPYVSANSMSELLDSDLIITGSGWMSTIENQVIRECNALGIPCITVLDHWVNYRERFIREPGSIPKMLAVSNLPALKLANEIFSDRPIWLLPDSQIESYKAFMAQSSIKKNVLIILEPTSTLSSEFAITDEMQEMIIRSAFQLKESRILENVVLRLHPSQDSSDQRFSNLMAKFPGMLLSIDKNLLDDLKLASIVLGFSTYGLYISAMCGLETKSYFAGTNDHWTIHFKDMIKALEN